MIDFFTRNDVLTVFMSVLGIMTILAPYLAQSTDRKKQKAGFLIGFLLSLFIALPAAVVGILCPPVLIIVAPAVILSYRLWQIQKKI